MRTFVAYYGMLRLRKAVVTKRMVCSRCLFHIVRTNGSSPRTGRACACCPSLSWCMQSPKDGSLADEKRAGVAFDADVVRWLAPCAARRKAMCRK